MVYDVLKRCIDLLLSVVGIVVLCPLLLVVAVAVRLNLGAPVLFRQRRPGLRGEIFVVYKFRTMADQRDQNGKSLPDESRLNPLGRFLRSTSLDELPELFNVAAGKMSLVGPRPLKVEYLELYSEGQARRHEVKPGITGWAQINGRNRIAWEEKFELDVWYVDNRSLWLDAQILFKTAVKVVKREGVNAEGHASMPDFRGNQDNTITYAGE